MFLPHCVSWIPINNRNFYSIPIAISYHVTSLRKLFILSRFLVNKNVALMKLDILDTRACQYPAFRSKKCCASNFTLSIHLLLSPSFATSFTTTKLRYNWRTYFFFPYNFPFPNQQSGCLFQTPDCCFKPAIFLP